MKNIRKAVGTLEEWVNAYENPENLVEGRPGSRLRPGLRARDDKLLVFKGKTGAFAGCERVYIPIGSSTVGARLPNGDDTSISWREALIELTHEELQH